MSDPLPTDDPRAQVPASQDAERAAKIEQLLLAGLEPYFAGEYDQAINVWTRALFLDRSHARARAYIDRARSAQAERQRAGEELLQRGVHAFNQGEASDARRLLQDAMDQGAPVEEALVILERLNRLEQLAPLQPSSASKPLPAMFVAPASPSRAAWLALCGLALVILAAGAIAVGAFRTRVPKPTERPVADVLRTQAAGEDVFAVPRRGERAFARAQALVRSGRWREALAPLESIRPTDPEKAEADKLRAEIQKQLIGLTRPDAAP